MRPTARNSRTLLSTLVLLAAPALAGCGAGPDRGRAGGDPPVGEVALALELTPGVFVTQLHYRISRSGAFVTEGEALAEERPVIRVTLAVAPQYRVELSATTSNGVRCNGTGIFAVTARESTMVRVPMTCPVVRGETTITPDFRTCPLITAVSATELQGSLGVFALNVTTTPPTPTRAYRWTAEVGILATPAAQRTEFNCPTRGGRLPVAIAVQDGDCRDNAGVTVDCGVPGSCGPLAGNPRPCDDCDHCLGANCSASEIIGCQGLSGQDRADCDAVLACTQRTACVAPSGDGLPCYCGTVGTDACLNGGGNGSCRTEVEVAGKTVNPQLLSDRFADPSFPLARAMHFLRCRVEFCSAVCAPR
jgi:hypothetical protein